MSQQTQGAAPPITARRLRIPSALALAGTVGNRRCIVWR